MAGARVFVLGGDRTISAFDGATGRRLWAQQRQGERHLTAAAPLSCDAWFATSARELAALAEARSASEQALAVLRNDAVQVRARLQLLEDAAAERTRASRRRVDAKADAALDDRIAAAWGRR